ncbi:YqiA/YcfP family alpha/beta fold hydrolase [Herminiimonas sp.]|uniref:YqiA/YcfP family alpha/beta fold hydrolase n=1 Tax=Herminiimonas sp. TaxID=1926289 RepID=UPI0027266346|nr:YqiA/YcfP family alpha/beta fold hydrolase [Herminiimonas sp.]MDO8305368.1 YqiA/YcfP family alpha/beta fold hydrolase [Herminiimonas sp.]
MILYLHGFRSSPLSTKTSLLASRMQALGRGDEYLCPQLPASPQAAIAQALEIAGRVAPSELTLIGSSLGGYYATWLAERLGCRAVLLNPAVHAARDLASQVGVKTQYHSNEAFEFKSAYIDELKALEVARITHPERYFLIAATGDELLDWREMVAQFPGARQHVITGSDHGISDFAHYADEVLAFCGVAGGAMQ